MLKLILIMGLMMLTVAVSARTPEVVLAAGTQLSATNNAIIDSATMNPGDEANFTLAADVKGSSGVIPKGSTLFGRVVEVEKVGGEKTESKLVIMFDFLQVGEDFYSMSAIIVSYSGAPAGIQLKESKEIEGSTLATLKGADINIAAGTAFSIRVGKDVEK